MKTALLASLLLCTPALAQSTRPSAAATPAPIVDAPTESAINGGLAFLASRQITSGAIPGADQTHIAAYTAFALHAFLSAGNLPDEGPHGKVVARGVDYLVEVTRPDGYIAAPTGEANMYGHGIATLVLGEVYGQSRPPPGIGPGGGGGGGGGGADPRLKSALERAVRLIIQTQNADGGWRYQPRVADADISVTLLQASALRVAKNAGLEVPQRTLDAATKYIRSCFDAPTGGFYYQARAGSPGFGRSCGAIYALQLLGYRDDPMVLAGSNYVTGIYGKEMDWFTYGNFYGAPAHFMIGGEAWANWYATAKSKILPAVQSQNGLIYWRALDPNGQNDVFATSVYITVLAMPYQFLPIYQR